MMTFESLPNELILDVFEYLDAVRLLRAFSDLNSRFHELLYVSFQSYHLDFQSVSKNDFNSMCRQHLPRVSSQIVSIHLADDDETPNLPDHFLSFHPNLNQFLHLQALALTSIQSSNLANQLISQCSQITHLKLIQCFFQDEVSHLINNIWSLRHLIDCHLDNLVTKGICFTQLSTVSKSIKYLSIENIRCDIPHLSHLFQHTPSLRQLSTTVYCSDKNDSLSIAAPFLRTLRLSFDGPLRAMQNLFQSMVDLRVLTLHTSDLLLNGHEWENLLLTSFTNLRKFQLKMSIQYPQSHNIEDEVDQLLATFQSDFWLHQHHWFVRCDWNPTNSFHDAILYTLPYAFEEFNYINETCSKSTCPNDEDYFSYEDVRSLQHETNLSYRFTTSLVRFPNISHLEIFLPFNEKFLSNIPSLDRLTSLDVTLLPDDSVYDQLQDLLNRASHLHWLRFSHLSDLEMILFQMVSTSIRRLDFFTKESMLYSWYFNREQCIALAQSPLGQQCQTLVLDIKHRTNVIDLINHMPRLQSLTVQCKDDRRTFSSNPTLAVFFLFSCTCTRKPITSSIDCFFPLTIVLFF